MAMRNQRSFLRDITVIALLCQWLDARCRVQEIACAVVSGTSRVLASIAWSCLAMHIWMFDIDKCQQNNLCRVCIWSGSRQPGWQPGNSWGRLCFQLWAGRVDTPRVYQENTFHHWSIIIDLLCCGIAPKMTEQALLLTQQHLNHVVFVYNCELCCDWCCTCVRQPASRCTLFQCSIILEQTGTITAIHC